jgi:hypothetical protein
MDLLLAGWILFWDIIIVTITVSITHYKLKKAERNALKERDAIESKFIQSAEDMRKAIVERIDAIEIPEIDISQVSSDLNASMAQSLNAHITGIKKQINDLKETVEKGLEAARSSSGADPDPIGRALPKLLERFL